MRIDELLGRMSNFVAANVTVRAGSTAPVTKSFPEFAQDIRLLQARLVAAGVAAGHVVGLQACATYEFLVWDLALIDMGAVPHVMPEDWTSIEIDTAQRSYGMDFVVTRHNGVMVLPGDANNSILRDGMRISVDAVHSTDPDVLTRVYSSGTTGILKGLLISRSGAEAMATQFADSFAVNQHDRNLIFLPLSHFQQRLAVYMCMFSGASFMLTPYAFVFHDLRRFQPTFLVGPPAFYETVYATLAGGKTDAAAAEKLLAGLGGQMRFMVTGMAPIRRNVLDAYNQLGQNLLEAYGITEVGLVAWNSAHDNRIGTVGKPVRDHQIAFGDESEILVKSAHPLTKGYFTAEDAVSAAQTFREDGFVATGDIGRFDGDHLVLSGRKKDIIITTGGAKFHPSDLERRLNTVDETRQVVVFNDPDSGAIVAVICVDDPDDKHTIELIERTVESINREVPTYMRISRKVLTRTRFTAENGFLTRNLKPNRPAIARSFAADAAAIR